MSFTLKWVTTASVLNRAVLIVSRTFEPTRSREGYVAVISQGLFFRQTYNVELICCLVEVIELVQLAERLVEIYHEALVE